MGRVCNQSRDVLRQLGAEAFGLISARYHDRGSRVGIAHGEAAAYLKFVAGPVRRTKHLGIDVCFVLGTHGGHDVLVLVDATAFDELLAVGNGQRASLDIGTVLAVNQTYPEIVLQRTVIDCLSAQDALLLGQCDDWEDASLLKRRLIIPQVDIDVLGHHEPREAQWVDHLEDEEYQVRDRHHE